PGRRCSPWSTTCSEPDGDIGRTPDGAHLRSADTGLDTELEEAAMEVQANGTTLYAEQAGEGPPLVFVHGMCGDARVWADQASRLGNRHQCTTYDRRGHTRSPRTDAVETV